MENTFNYDNLPVRTITDHNEETWFAGIDVCNILGYAKASTTIEKLDDDERKLEYLRDTSGQQRKTWILNEFGLYSLILTSTKPEAKAFKRWVTHEVLPSIRKAGKFTTEQEQEYEVVLNNYADKIQELRKLRDESQARTRELGKQIETMSLEMIGHIKMDRSQMKIDFNTLNNDSDE